MTKIIDGKVISALIKAELKDKTENLIKEKGIQPGLAVLLVGDNPASQSYVSSKEKASNNLGFYSIVERLDTSATQDEVLEILDKWNKDTKIHGILVQLPLPSQICENTVIQAIKHTKDVDGLHPMSVGKLVMGIPTFIACTPAGIMELLKRYEIETSGKHVVVLGRSNIVGKPIANLLYQKKKVANSIVTICHTGAKDFSYFTRQADILIVAIGSPLAIKSEHIKEGSVVIDVGINRIEDNTTTKGYRLVGDVDFESVKDKCSAITPVPGGVGPMTITMLLNNTYKSAAGLIN
jgi:methylenetetrahydrofolate dehydrogenase (NADP+) / methenyltetrahydrofolate cyclohydrolase